LDHQCLQAPGNAGKTEPPSRLILFTADREPKTNNPPRKERLDPELLAYSLEIVVDDRQESWQL
jgi:hypothetical protein